MVIKEIKNGNLNRVFKFIVNDNIYIIRSSNFSNSFECEILKILEKNKINSPKLKSNFLFENKNVMICDFIDGNHSGVYTFDFLKKIIKEMKKVHKIDVSKINLNNENVEDIKKLKKYYNISINSLILKKDKKYIEDIMNYINDLDIDIFPQCIIHSDIKNENVLIKEDEVFLIDFGNSYFGSRLIDIIRFIMWFYLKEDNYDIIEIKALIDYYFENNYFLSLVELMNVEKLLYFCLLYNLLKDVYLFETKKLPKEYIVDNSLKWLKILKEKDKLIKIVGVFENVKRFTE